MTDITLAPDTAAETQEEKIWVVNTLLQRQIALCHGQPADEITHDIRLALIGREGEYVHATRFDSMTKLFSEMGVSNIHIQHVCLQNDVSPSDGSLGDTPNAGDYPFMLSDVLSWFGQELSEYDDNEKLKQSQSLGMFLVFMVKKSFMEHFEGGLSLANFFLGAISQFPGMAHIAEALCRPPEVSALSSADVARAMFRYTAGLSGIPDDEIGIIITQDDGVLDGIEGAMAYFEAIPDGGKGLGVSCHYIPYIPEETPPKGVIRLSDLICVVATLLPVPGQQYDDVTDNMLGLLYHVCNSNLKGIPPITPEELQGSLLKAKHHIAERLNQA